jgi:hypothetical protein
VFKLKLGIVYKDNKIINHRSLLKVLLNPFLRYIGLYIGTKCKDNTLKGIKLNKCVRTQKIIWSFIYNVEYDYIQKRRIII